MFAPWPAFDGGEGFEGLGVHAGFEVDARKAAQAQRIGAIGEHLGRGIAVLIHLLNPELIIIGGELTKAENYLVDPIQQNLNKYTISKIRRDAQIITSSLGNNAGLLGTVALVMNKVFAKE